MKTMRNVRVVIVAERHGHWLTHGDTLRLPAGHLREGESLRYALARIAREACGAEIRVRDVAAIAEREGRRAADRCIEVYVRASILGAGKKSHVWAALDDIVGVEPHLATALAHANGAPYLGNLRRHAEGIRTSATQRYRSKRTQ